MKKVAKSKLPIKILDAIQVALRSQKRAYARYSKYKVGASVIDEKGRIHGGCNVENIAFKVTDAERSAVSEMIEGGGTRITAVVVATKDGGTPCGDCRQHIWEHSKGEKKTPIYLVDKAQRVKQTTIGELLPFAFHSNNYGL